MNARPAVPWTASDDPSPERIVDEPFQQPDTGLSDDIEKIAVVGMAGRYPGAPDVESFWQNLVDGVDSLHEFSDEELDELGIGSEIYGRENFVRRGTILPGHDCFDHEMFGFSPREAAIIDPQSRVFLETAHAALEHAGYDPFSVPGEVGVFAGCNPIDYALLLGQTDPTDSLTSFDQMIGNDRDFLATRVSHRLNLKGPAINVQSACSTSLVAVHLAAQHLLDYHCSMALAGGVSINLRQGVGYFYQQGMILSPDGVCRAFDRNANGTTLGQGSGAVVLKRLSDAIADGDTIHAVIAGSAINNDGSGKISYTAPSAEGQAEVIATAHAVAGLGGDEITYVETHGTGTNLGDPVEIAGLTKAFRQTTDETEFCAIGSVKTNVGHTDAAAGITGFIKAVLAVREGVIPPSLHFREPNEAIDFSKSPFFVAEKTLPWKPTTTQVRRAGVSSFGIGGTNAHAIIEQGPADTLSSNHEDAHQPARIVIASSKSAEGADATMAEVMNWHDQGRLGPSEIATLQLGRTAHLHRRVAVIGSSEQKSVAAPVVRNGQARGEVNTVWMFSGQGAQYPGMAVGLYGILPVFTETLDNVLTQLQATGPVDLRPLLLADRDDPSAAEKLQQTAITQPALFAMQYAMAKQLQSWGVTPRAVLGHSIGEFTAATVAGILDWKDAVSVVVQRGRLMQAMQPGRMVAARLSADHYRTLLPEGVELATANSTAASVAAGPADRVDVLLKRLADEGVDHQTLATSHAFHTASMAPAAAEFAKAIAKIDFHAPSIPMLSNVSGDWLNETQATDPEYWASQIRQTVRFDDCLARIGKDQDVLVEVGPGRALSTFAAGHVAFDVSPTAVSCIGNAREKRSGDVVALDAVGRLWTEGVELNWQAINQTSNSRRVPAPRSVLARHRHWAPEKKHVLALDVDASSDRTGRGGASPTAKKQREPIDRWCYARAWRRSSVAPSRDRKGLGRAMLLVNDTTKSNQISARLSQLGDDVIIVRLAKSTDLSVDEPRLAAADEEGMRQLLAGLAEQDRIPGHVIHLWSIEESHASIDMQTLRNGLAKGTDTLLALARSLSPYTSGRNIQIDVVATGVHDVMGGERVFPSAAAMSGPVKVIPLEYSGLDCRLTDLPLDANESVLSRAAQSLIAPIGTDPIVAIRGNHRWVHDVDVQELQPTEDADLPIRHGGNYLIVGGLGGVGLSIAKHLATKFRAKIALTSRSGKPEPDSGNPETTRRLERLQEIEDAASELMIESADATSTEDMGRVVATVEDRLGPIDGVIVAAAVADNEGAIHRRSPEAAEAAISAKVHGSVVLAEVLPERELDFVLLSSSIASQLYHNRFGQVGYVTSNSFVEAMADARAFNARRVVTMAWDDWVDIGMSVRAAQEFRQNHGSDIELMDEVHSFAPEDGIQLFERALLSDASTLFVSTTNLRRRVEEDVFVSSPFLEQALSGGDEGEVSGESTADIVLEVWKSLLGIDDISPTSDFFELGGDSLQVARMADRLRRSLDIDVSLDLVFDNPTPQALTEAIEKLSGSGGSNEQLQAILGIQPAIPAQRRFLERDSAVPGHFNISALLRAEPAVGFQEFAAAAEKLVAIHDALRTKFQRVESADESEGVEWSQVVQENGDGITVIEEVDLSADASGTTIEQLGEKWQSEFDIIAGPLARFSLIDLPDGQQRIFLGLHHLISDRLSLLNLIDMLDLLLDPAGEQSLGSPPPPFSQWARSLQQYVDSSVARDDQAHWDALDHTAEESWPIPEGKSVAECNLNRHAVARKIRFGREESDMLLRGSEGRSDEIILLALSDAVRDWSGNSTIGIDVLGHGRRNLPELNVARTVGFFLSYSPVWFTDESARQGVSERVESLRNDIHRAWTFDPLRYGRPSPGTTRPRPTILYNFVGRPIAADAPRRITVVDEFIGAGTHPDNPRDHQIAVMVEISSDEEVIVTIVSSSELQNVEDVDRLELQLRTAVARLCEPTARLQASIEIAREHVTK